MGKSLLFLMFLSVRSLLMAQWGCTDPQASNFSAGATQNDGSCLYNQTNYSMNLIQNLTDVVQENSGLVRIGDFLYTFNDSGFNNQLYELDTLGTFLRTITVAGASNVDWEAITANDSNVFIGDFGNNNGNRQNLCLYRFQKNTISSDTVYAEKLPFYWEDQSSFSHQTNAHNFDCEAFFATADSITLFSKNWSNLWTKTYKLPIHWSDTIAAELRDSFFVDGLITDATISATNAHAYLLGYKNNGNNFYTSFVWCLWDFQGPSFFSGNKRRIEIGNVLNLAQTEGIALNGEHKGYISSEKVTSVITIPAKLFEFNLATLFESNASLPLLLSPSAYYVWTDLDGINVIQINIPYKNLIISDIQGRSIFRTSSSNPTIKLNHHGQIILNIDDHARWIYLP